MTAPADALVERINAAIRDYDAQGWHRTGTAVDSAAAHWLAEQVRACGLEPALEPFSLSRIDHRSCFIQAAGRRIDGLPAFDGGLTDATGITGRLGTVGSGAPIAVLNVPVGSLGSGSYVEARRSGGHAAVVAVTQGRRTGLAVLNAPSFDAPFGPPVLMVGSDEGAWLTDQAERGIEARVVVAAVRTEAEALNVVAHLPGSDPTLQPLVVMTPRSGWWQCASERGGGIACWLAVMHALNAGGAARNVIFLASSGHELGHLGLKAFMASRPTLARDALAWVHFGANIGAAQEGGYRIAASDDELRRLALSLLQEQRAPQVEVAPNGWVPAGEAQNVHDAGGRYLSLVGSNALFHLEADRWPDAIDATAIEGFARAFAVIAARLT